MKEPGGRPAETAAFAGKKGSECSSARYFGVRSQEHKDIPSRQHFRDHPAALLFQTHTLEQHVHPPSQLWALSRKKKKLPITWDEKPGGVSGERPVSCENRRVAAGAASGGPARLY